MGAYTAHPQFSFPQQKGSQGSAYRRLVVALAGSLLLHCWVAGGAGSGMTRAGGQAGKDTAIHVQLTPAASEKSRQNIPVTAPGLERPSPREYASAPDRLEAAPPSSHAVPVTSRAMVESGATLDPGLPGVPDPTYYGVRQLDVFPHLVLPLSFGDGAPSRRWGRVLVQLQIDEQGVVTEFTLVEGEPAAAVEAGLRPIFMAARFSPGRRAGRAVKSRVLINVDYGTAREAAAAP